MQGSRPSEARSIDLRGLLAGLAEQQARAAAARWLLVVCAVGFASSVVLLAGLGDRLDHWLFVLLVWTVLIYVPLRVLIESAEAFGQRRRQRLDADVAADPVRHERIDYLPHIVRDLATRHVTMPRISPPVHTRQVQAAAVGVLARIQRSEDPAAALRGVLRALVALVGTDTAVLSARAGGEAAHNIQARWDLARSVGSLAALTSVLAWAHVDRWHAPPVVPELDGRDVQAYLDDAMEYCDEAALQVDPLPWTEGQPATNIPTPTLDAMRAAWAAFLSAGHPAPRALDAFLGTLPRQISES